MALTKEQKGEILEKLKANLKDAKSVVFADYQGLSVKEMQELRRELRKSGVEFNIAKKTLIRLAAKDAGHEELSDEVLEGPVGVAFNMEDEIAAAKILHNFGKKHENLKLRGAIFEGRVLSVAETKELALIPGKDELISKFIYLIKSPVSGFHGVLYNTVAGFVRVLDAVREKQEQTA